MTGPSTPRGAIDVIHLDMNAFFAAVEVLERPELAGRPVLVGGAGARGVVASASYEARAYGVRSAMAMGEARRRCPDAVVIGARHDRYREVSERLHAILRAYTPVVEPVALDEAYLDVAGAHRHFGTSAEIGAALRARVESELGLSCSVGVGRTKLVAKLASEAAKPRALRPGHVVAGRGLVVVGVEEETAFLLAHPVRALPGVGPRTAERLAALGISTVADLAALDRSHLTARFGVAHGGALYELAHGEDRRRVEADRAVQSIGHEETFAHDERDRAALERRLRDLAISVIERCASAGVLGRTVQVKIRLADFSSHTRQRTLEQPVATAAHLAEVAIDLLGAVEIPGGVRLLGLSVSSFGTRGVAEATQLDLFGADEAEPSRLDEARLVADSVRRRFGAGAIASGAQLGRRAGEAPAVGETDPGRVVAPENLRESMGVRQPGRSGRSGGV